MNKILKSLFSSETRIKILSHFFRHPGENFYLRQLEKILGISVGQLRPELRNLEAIGLLTSNFEGNQRRYSIEGTFLIHDELKSIFLKTTAIGDVIREPLTRMEGVELAFIFGSFAKGEERTDSDIDVMIVGSTPVSEINRVISDVELKLNRTVNYSLYERKEIEKRFNDKDTFITTVFSDPKILLLGNKEDELFRAA